MMEAAIISETSINFYQATRRYIPEDSYLHVYIFSFINCTVQCREGKGKTGSVPNHHAVKAWR
jgi:hypothetical protein